MRYEKVRDAMQSDPALAALLGKPTEWVGKQNQTGEMFAKEVVQVTAAIYSAGRDACDMKPPQIVHFATDMLILNIAPPVVAKPPAPPAPKPTVVKPKPVKPKPPAKPKPKPKPEAKKPEPKKPAVVPPPSAPPEPEPAPEPVAEVKVAAPERVVVPARPVRPKSRVVETDGADPQPSKHVNGFFKPLTVIYIKKNVPWVPGVVLMCHAQAIATILEAYANDPEARELLDDMNRFIEHIHRKTVLPNCAQEDTKSG